MESSKPTHAPTDGLRLSFKTLGHRHIIIVKNIVIIPVRIVFKTTVTTLTSDYDPNVMHGFWALACLQRHPIVLVQNPPCIFAKLWAVYQGKSSPIASNNAVSFRWTPHPVTVAIRDNKNYIRVLLYSYCGVRKVRPTPEDHSPSLLQVAT